jgi:hypothetical protein
MVMLQTKHSRKDLLLTVLSVLSIYLFFGDLWPGSIKIMGVSATLFRTFIPCLFLALLIRKIIRREFSVRLRPEMILYIFLLVWLVYAMVSLYLNTHFQYKEGMKEAVRLALCFAGVFCIVELLLCTRNVEPMLQAIRISMLVVMVISLIEFSTGWHFPFSMLTDPRSNFSTDVSNLSVEMMRFESSGFFYNPNDLCALLVIFSPVFFPNKNYSTGKISGVASCLLF